MRSIHLSPFLVPHADAFDAIPDRPPPLTKSFGLIVHLVSFKRGIIKSIHHIEEIQSLPSALKISMTYSEGDQLLQTVDIRTDAGYVLLANNDPDVLKADYRQVVQWQRTMFEVVGDDDADAGLHAPSADTDAPRRSSLLDKRPDFPVSQAVNLRGDTARAIAVRLIANTAVLSTCYLLFMGAFTVVLPLFKFAIIK